MANTLRFKRGLVSGIPTAALGEPLFTTDTFDLYIGNGTTNTRFQKYIASGTTSQLLRGDGSLLTMPIVLTSPSTGQVLKYNGTSWVNDSDAGITGSGAAGQVAFFTGATTQGGSNNLFWDNTNGRLGIGTNIPAYKLEVIGTNGIGVTAGNGNQLYLNNTGQRFTQISFDNNTSGSSKGAIYWDNTNSSFEMYAASGGGLIFHTNATPRARITSGGNFIINNPSTDNGLRFQVTGDGYFSGSVGIGVSPAYKLDVYGDARFGDGNNFNPLIQFAGSGRAAGSPGYSFVGDLDTGMYNPNLGNTIAFSTAGVERMRLDASGNLGLGVVPSAWSGKSLQIVNSSFTDVASSLQLSYNAYFDGSNWRYITSAAAANYYQGSGAHIWRTAASGTAGNAITFTQAMTLDASGRLGIGTASPTAPLHVVGTNVIIQQYTGSPNTFAFGQYDVSGNASINNLANANLLFATNNTERMRIFSDGNVAIGTTTNATYKLDVNGTMRVSGGSTFNGLGIFSNNLNVSHASNNAFITITRPSNTYGSGLNLYTGATQNWLIGTAWGETSSNFVLYNAGTSTQSFKVDYSTNAATFSSSVTVGGTINTNAGTIFAKASGTEGGQYQLSSLTMGYDATNNLGWITAAGAAARTNLALQGGGGNVLVGTISAISGASSTRFVVVQNQADWTQLIKTNTVTGSSYGLRIDAGTNASDSAISINNASATTNFFNINGTGAATFSSSVTGASFIPTSSTIPTNGMYLSAANTLAFATASGNKLTISSTGLATFSDSARFSNLKGCIFVQTGGSLLGSISMDSSNQVTIDNNGFFGLSVGSNYTMTGGNLGIGHAQFGTSATRTISVVNGTAPSTSPTDAFQMYSNDVVAGNAAPHFRTENGAVIKLYQETTAVGNAIISLGGGNAVLDDTTFDGYTLRQIVRALRNQGILQ